MAQRKTFDREVITASDMPDERKRTVAIEVAVGSLVPNPMQPRSNYDPDKLADLAKSIKAKGVIQPLVVEKLESGYQIVFGHRRWYAAQDAKLETVPCIVRKVETNKDRLLLALTENVVRDNMSEIDEGRSYLRLQDEFEMTQDEIAAETGVDQSQISRAMRLAKAPEQVQEWVETETISPSAARTILAAASTPKAVERVIEKAATAIQNGKVTAKALQVAIAPRGGKQQKSRLTLAIEMVNKAIMMDKAIISNGRVVEL